MRIATTHPGPSVPFYMPRLPDADLPVLMRFSVAQWKSQNSEFYLWLFGQLSKEYERRTAHNRGEIPPDVELLVVPDWPSAALGEALVEVSILSYLRLGEEAAELVDALVLHIVCKARDRLASIEDKNEFPQ